MFPSHPFVVLSIVLAGVHVLHAAPEQRISELAADRATADRRVPVEIPTPPGDYVAKTVEEMTRESDAILHARLSKIRSYLDASGDSVLSDYRIQMIRVIAGHLPAWTADLPGAVAPLVLTVAGGEVIVDGVRIRVTDTNREALRDDGEYVVFVSRSRSRKPGAYEIHAGGIFDVTADGVKPLLKSGARVFADAVGETLPRFIERIEAADQDPGTDGRR